MLREKVVKLQLEHVRFKKKHVKQCMSISEPVRFICIGRGVGAEHYEVKLKLILPSEPNNFSLL